MRFLLALAVLALAAVPASAQDMSLDPAYGTVSLTGGFLPDPKEVSLMAGGTATPDVEGCGFGRVAEAPDVKLSYTVSGSHTLYLYVRSETDTTLLVNLSNGSWVCNDDGLGNENPVLVIPNAPTGHYDIWVGTFGDDVGAATLYISEIDPR